MDSKHVLIIGIQDIDGIPYGATLRVKQHANEIQSSTYLNLGKKQSWNSLPLHSKAWETFWFRPWKDPYSTYHYSKVNAEKLRDVLKKNDFDVILVSEIWGYGYLKTIQEYRKNARIVIDFHNVESALQLDMAKKTKGFVKRFISFWRFILIKWMEIQWTKIANDVWVCSLQDKSIFDDTYGIKSKIVSNRIDLKDMRISKLSGNRSIGFVGCFNYPPNMDAALELLYKIQPRLSGSVLYLVGKHPSERLLAWRSNHVIVTGEVEDIKPYMEEIRTMVFPIRTGSGTRLKVLNAMAYGIPIVATAKAVEGIGLVPGVHYLQALLPDDFKNMIEFLWMNPTFEEFMIKAARRFVECEATWKTYAI